MEMESATGSLPERVTAATGCRIGVNAKLKQFENSNFLWSHWRMGTFGPGGGDLLARKKKLPQWVSVETVIIPKVVCQKLCKLYELDRQPRKVRTF